MTAAARRTTRRVAAATPGSSPMLRTSRPCAVTTSGARPARAAIKPLGTRKCAYTTSGRAAGELEVAELAARTRVEHGSIDLVAALGQRVLHLRHERPQVRGVRAGI